MWEATHVSDNSFHSFKWLQPKLRCTRESMDIGAEVMRVNSLVAAAKECRGRLEQGREVYNRAVEAGCVTNKYVHSSLIKMFAGCKSMVDAESVFNRLVNPDLVSWNCLIWGYIKNGQSRVALQIFNKMELVQDVDSRTFVAVLAACAALTDEDGCRSKILEKGKALHSQAVLKGCYNFVVEGALVDLYAKCGIMVHARCVFDSIVVEHVEVALNSLMQGYIKNGETSMALQVFESAEEAGNGYPSVYNLAVAACVASLGKPGKWFEKAKTLHSRSVHNGCCDIYVTTTLINMYAKCGRMGHARAVFDNLESKEVVQWNCILHGYLENGESEMVLELFERMEEGGCLPDDRTYGVLLGACAAQGRGNRTEWLEKGKAFHSQVVMEGFENSIVETTLVNMYAKCGSMVHSRRVFDSMVSKRVVSWNALLQGYARNDQCEMAVETFEVMQEADFSTTDQTFLALIVGCAALANREGESPEKLTAWLEKGKAIHSQAAMNGSCNIHSEEENKVLNALVDMYAKFGRMPHSRGVFDSIKNCSVVAWNTVIQGHAENDEVEVALEMFRCMLEEHVDDGVVPDDQTYLSVLGASAGLADKIALSLMGRRNSRNQLGVEAGKAIHSQAVMSGCCDKYVGTALMNMYGRWGGLVHSQAVFESMELFDDPVAWNALAVGYAVNGDNGIALELIAHMDLCGISQLSGTFVTALMACTNLMALELGRIFHEEARLCGFLDDPKVGNCLLELYGRCGRMDLAQQLFDSSSYRKDLVHWNVLISGYCMSGGLEHVPMLLQKMREADISPDAITFSHILNACSHAGLVEQGKAYFAAMKSEYGIVPNLIHYCCLIDLFGRANHLEEAVKLANEMPYELNNVGWTTILSACSKWKDFKIAETAYEALLRMDKDDGVAYTLMAKMYSRAGMEEESVKVVACGEDALN